MNGFYIHLSELQLLLNDYNATAVSLQETHLKDINTPVLRGFTIYRKDKPFAERASGGVAVLVRNNVFSENVPL